MAEYDIARLALWAAMAFLALLALGVIRAAFTVDGLLPGLLANRIGDAPMAGRGTFLAVQLVLAGTFLVRVLGSGGDPEALRAASTLIEGIEMGAAAGGASLFYLFSKVSGR